MIESLALAVVLVSLGAGVVVCASAAGDRYRWARVVPTVAIVETAVLVQFVADLVGLARGHRPGEPATHLAYLACSLVVLPVVAATAARDDGRWAGVLVAAGFVVLAVLVLRMQATWRSVGG